MLTPSKVVPIVLVAIVLAIGAAITFGGKSNPSAPDAPPQVPEKEGPANAVVLVYDRGEIRVTAFHERDALAALEKCFPGYRKRPASDIAAPWKQGAEVYFNFPHGNTVRLAVSHQHDNGDPVLWSVGQGDFEAVGDFYKLVSLAGNVPGVKVGVKPEPWSEVVKGLKARLVLERGQEVNGTPLVSTYLELHNVSSASAPILFPWAEAVKRWVVTDAAGAKVPVTSLPGNELSAPVPTLLIPHGSTLRLDVTKTACGIDRNLAAHLDLGLENCWDFKRGEIRKFALGGTVTIPPAGKDLWSGTLTLPKVPIPLTGE